MFEHCWIRPGNWYHITRQYYRGLLMKKMMVFWASEDKVPFLECGYWESFNVIPLFTRSTFQNLTGQMNFDTIEKEGSMANEKFFGFLTVKCSNDLQMYRWWTHTQLYLKRTCESLNSDFAKIIMMHRNFNDSINFILLQTEINMT